MDSIQIALASDQNYLPGLRVTAASIACYASRNVELVYHILDGGIQDETFEDLRLLLIRIHPHVIVHRYCIDHLALKDCPEYGGSRLTYARLLLPELLPDVHHIIYCDCDFLWRADIAELWKEKDDSVIYQSTRDGVPQTLERENKWFVENGYSFDPQLYFCAGLSFFNLELFRKEKVSKRAFDFLHRYQNINSADQTALNVILFGQVRLVSQKWQRFSRDVTSEELKSPIVLHYADELPWRRQAWWNLLTDTVLIWHRFNDLLLGARGGSLAIFFSLRQIILKRGLNQILRIQPGKWLFYQILCLTGRGSYRSGFDTWSRHLGKCPMPDHIFRTKVPEDFSASQSSVSKRMLIMTDSMVCGGVEKSLLSLMAVCEDYAIDLVLTHKRGSLLSYVPNHCRVLSVPWTQENEYEWEYGNRKYLSALLVSLRWGQAIKLLFTHLVYLRWAVPAGKRRAVRFMKMVQNRMSTNVTHYDIAISYGDTTEILMYVLKTVHAKRKVAWIHNDFPLSYFDRAAFGEEYKAFDLVVACSVELTSTMSKLLQEKGVVVSYIPHILDRKTYLKLASESQPFVKNNCCLNIVSVGRVCEQKGFDIAIEVCEKLKKQGINVQWYVVGDGDKMGTYKQQAVDKGLEKDFHFVGQKLNPYPYIYNCDIYVQPSRYEGYCLTLAEARLLGKPIVTTDFVGAREQIKDGITGVIVKCDSQALADAVCRLVRDPRLREEFSVNLLGQNYVQSDTKAVRMQLFGEQVEK